MAGETVITVIGNLTADPELRWTNNGVALASFSVASTPRVFDRKANEWRDGEALFLRCTVWREAAENVANTLTKGTRVIVTGSLRQRNYEVEGQRRTSYELDVDEIGPSLRYATAQVTRTPPRGGAGGGGGFGGGQQQGGDNMSAPQQQQTQSDQPWGRGASSNDGWANPGQSFDNEAPF